jgi:hypothetical protein
MAFATIFAAVIAPWPPLPCHLTSMPCFSIPYSQVISLQACTARKNEATLLHTTELKNYTRIISWNQLGGRGG